MLQQKNYKSYSKLYPQKGRRTLLRLLAVLAAIFILLLFVPWQQNVNASGRIIALRPEERPQFLQTAISGRIKEWRVFEGKRVKKGDTLVIISEVKEKYLDPELVTRLGEQKDAKQQGIESLVDKIAAIEKQIAALEKNMQLSYEKNINKLRQSKLKVRIDSAELQSAKLDAQVALKQLQRTEKLQQDGLKSVVDVEQKRVKWQDALSKESNAMDKLMIAINEVQTATILISDEQNSYNEKIAKVQSDMESTQSYIAESKGSVSKLRNEQQDAFNRRKFQVITAPQNGFISKVIRAGLGEILKENETLITLVPDNPQLAAELMVDATHISLVQVNNIVRLRFDGWPVLQVSGWPEASLGTYGGKVQMVDIVANADGKYRVLVVPDKTTEAWPTALRQGTSTYGWVLMNEVPIWFELWRQINGFPVSPTKDKSSESTKK
ncbi:MAG: biotin/lipoyl-binding protein [Sphingobacteriales bacterium]|nr:MAG: biotin/lipoyl-binding protein [Sphingobacteriales bacterium]